MNKLEQEIFSALGDAIETLDDDMNGEYEAYAKAAAEVAKKYIEGAMESCAHFTASLLQQSKYGNWPQVKEKWLKENGIT